MAIDLYTPTITYSSPIDYIDNVFTLSVSYGTPANYATDEATATIFYSDPYPSVSGTFYINRVWDTSVAGTDKTHYWTTSGSPDSTGASYDGPGTWGVTTSDYCVEAEYAA